MSFAGGADIAQNFGGGIAARGAHHAAAGMGGRSAHPQILDRAAILRIARHRAVEEQLVEGQLALEDVAFGQADLGLQLARRAHLDVQDAVLEARRVFLDLVEAGRAEGVAVGIGPVAAFDLRRGVLHEAGHEMLARRGHRRVDHGGDHHVLERIGAEMPGLPVVIGALHLLDGIGEMHVALHVRRAFRQGGEFRRAVQRDVQLAR